MPGRFFLFPAMTKALSLAQSLINCPSVTPDEAGTIRLLSDVLSPAGFTADVETTPNGTTNAVFAHGSGRPVYAFAGHVDVVPAGDPARWATPPFTATVKDGELRGRGAADMKSSDAAAAVAFARFAEEHPDHPGTLMLIITSDEEGDGDEGTRLVVEKMKAQGVTIDACIVGEPTSSKVFGDTVKNGRRGSLNGVLTVKGKQGHVAYPHLADNPVHRAAPVLAELTSRVWDNGNTFFGPTTFQTSNIHAGVGATNVVPGECVITFNFRFNTEWTAEKLKAAVTDVCDKAGIRYEIKWQLSAEPFQSTPAKLTAALTAAITKETGVTPALNTAGGTSDARYISRICPETVEFGPVNATIHAVDERIDARDVERLAAIYHDTLKTLFA